ncbi:MAG: Xaa-Pro peptidase family protein [Planctomycetota bacterium]
MKDTGQPMTASNPIHDPQRLAQLMDSHGLDALIASSFKHAFYLSGFYVDPAGMGDDFEGTCTLAPALRVAALFRNPSVDPFFVLPSETAPDNTLDRTSWITDVRTHGPLLDTGAENLPRGQDPWTVVLDALADRGVSRSRIGLELSQTALNLQTVAPPSFARLQRALPDVEWIDASPLFAELRLVKTPEEIARLTFVQNALDRAAGIALESMRAGMTEIALDRLFRHALVDQGVDHRLTQITFAPDKWQRTRAWFPTGQKLARGNVINFDVSARYRMYLSDLGVTAFCGEPSARAAEITAAVRAAHLAARRRVAPGASPADIYAAAVEVLRDADVPPSLDIAGHGVGLSLHEQPLLGPANRSPLKLNMVIAVEILAYAPGIGIFQAEDVVVVTQKGCRPLSRIGAEFPRL